MYIDRSLLDKNVVAPHLIEQLPTAMHALSVRHEKVQQAELGRPEIERLAIATGTLTAPVVDLYETAFSLTSEDMQDANRQVPA